eukprot:s11_g43.t1
MPSKNGTKGHQQVSSPGEQVPEKKWPFENTAPFAHQCQCLTRVVMLRGVAEWLGMAWMCSACRTHQRPMLLAFSALYDPFLPYATLSEPDEIWRLTFGEKLQLISGCMILEHFRAIIGV